MERLWSVRLRGERATDAGGPYRETVSHMFADLQSKEFDLFVLTPNSDLQAESTKLYVPNPTRAAIEADKDMFRFVGFMMGYGIVNSCPVPIDLPRFVMRKIVSVFSFCPVSLPMLSLMP